MADDFILCEKHEKPFCKFPARPGHPLFYQLLEQMADLHARKNQNYAEDGHPLSNLKGCARLGLPPVMGVVVRLQDKWSRIEQLVKGKPDLVGESLEDTLMDNAIYSLLAIVLLREGAIKKEPFPFGPDTSMG